MRRAASGISGSASCRCRPPELNRRMRFWFGGEPSEVRQRRDEAIRERFAGLLERAAARRAGRLGGRPAAAAEPHHPARPVSAQHLPRHGTRLRPRHPGARPDALGHAIGGGCRAGRWWSGSSSTCRCSTPRAARCRMKSVAAFRRLRTEAPRELQAFFASSARSAENHRAIIEQFGRFPHRNARARARQYARGSRMAAARAARASVSESAARAPGRGCDARARAVPPAAPPPGPRRSHSHPGPASAGR